MRSPRLVIGIAVVAALAAMPAWAAGTAESSTGRAPVRATIARSCSLSTRGQSLGPTYVTRLSVHDISCHSAYKLVHSYYRCRVRHGGVTGHCGSVEGFHCHERRFAKISVEYDASVTCTRGSQVVKHDYTPFT